MATNGTSPDSHLKPGDLVLCGGCGVERTVFEIPHPITKQPRQMLGECDCHRKAWAEERAHRERKEMERRREQVADRFGGLELPEALASKSLGGFEETSGAGEAFQTARRFVTTLPERIKAGHGVIFSGPCGTGKTHLGAAIANAVNASGRAAIHADTNALLERIKNLWGTGDKLGRLQAAILDADLLVLEDLGQEVADKRELAYLFGWLNGRYTACRSVIITTNMTPHLFKQRYSEAILSRLRERCKWVTLTGDDFRTRLRVDW